MPPVVLTEIPAQKRPASAERFFQWSLFLLVATGFVALMGTNRLDLPSLALVVSALLLRACLLLMHKEISIPERWTSLLTLAYFAFYAADFFYFSQTFITATVHLVLFILVVKIFSVRRDRDLVYLAVISFLMLLAAAVLTVDTLFLLAFALYIMVAIATFVSMEMRRSEKESLSAEIPPKHGLEFYRSLAGIASVLGALTLGGAALIFFILPRLNNAGYLGNLGAQGEIASGFSQDVRLGGIGQIQQSSAVVMHIQVLSGRLPLDAKWRGLSLSNFDGQRWWNIAEVANYHGLNNAPLDLTRYTSLAAPSRPLRRFATLSYRVVMEPVGLDVFFLAPVPLKLGGDYRTIAIASDGSVFSRRPAGNYFSEAEAAQPIGLYTADADTRDPSPLIHNSISSNYPPHVSSLYLQLPRLDPRIPELAKTITAGVRSNYEKAHAIETYLQNNFGYTLQLPGKNNADPLAYFLFERKKGHCEYFASAMTIMLRTLGIPARV
ncbi:MAG TPA: DUF3488 and transglutaminase-like domain-containing protein, partial [Terriglobales bacterium]|nr:DUF3488 and transglutaminase-like domain-containing protein [Terriglobales bacterium]